MRGAGRRDVVRGADRSRRGNKVVPALRGRPDGREGEAQREDVQHRPPRARLRKAPSAHPLIISSPTATEISCVIYRARVLPRGLQAFHPAAVRR